MGWKQTWVWTGLRLGFGLGLGFKLNRAWVWIGFKVVVRTEWASYGPYDWAERDWANFGFTDIWVRL